jgi:heme O synthase-like polyprenyltransferase
METFRYSIVYLGVLFVMLLVDHYTVAGVGVGPLVSLVRL